MRTVADLRRALVEETSELAVPPMRLAEIKRRARRRMFLRGYLAMLTGLLVALGGVFAAVQPGGHKPGPLPSPTVSIAIDPSFSAYGHVITTGARVGTDYELVMWFANGPDTVTIASGLLDRRTGAVRDLESLSGMYQASAKALGFQMLSQVDDRNGAVLDYGLYVGPANRIVEQVRGQQYETHLAQWSVNPAFTVFWVDRPGTPLPTDSNHPVDPGADAPRFVAYGPAGQQVARSDGVQSRRSDAGFSLEDQPQVGGTIATGSRLADGTELVFWFVGSGDQALLKAGGRGAANRITELKVLGAYHQPPFAIGFYHAWDDFAGPAGTHIMVGSYAGPASKVVAGAPGAAVHSGFAHWSAHPELILFWADHVATADYPQTAAVAYDAAGKVIGALSYGG